MNVRKNKKNFCSISYYNGVSRLPYCNYDPFDRVRKLVLINIIYICLSQSYVSIWAWFWMECLNFNPCHSPTVPKYDSISSTSSSISFYCTHCTLNNKRPIETLSFYIPICFNVLGSLFHLFRYSLLTRVSLEKISIIEMALYITPVINFISIINVLCAGVIKSDSPFSVAYKNSEFCPIELRFVLFRIVRWMISFKP